MTYPIKGPAQVAIERSITCGKRGPRTGAFCVRFKGHEQPPSPLLGADFHEARDTQGVIERWEVSPEEVTAREQAIEQAIRREVGETDPGPEPLLVGKEAELDEVKKLLAAAGLRPRDTFQRAGAPGSGVWYAELNNAEPLILRVQILFGRSVSWALMSVLAPDLDSLREALQGPEQHS